MAHRAGIEGVELRPSQKRQRSCVATLNELDGHRSDASPRARFRKDSETERSASRASLRISFASIMTPIGPTGQDMMPRPKRGTSGALDSSPDLTKALQGRDNGCPALAARMQTSTSPQACGRLRLPSTWAILSRPSGPQKQAKLVGTAQDESPQSKQLRGRGTPFSGAVTSLSGAVTLPSGAVTPLSGGVPPLSGEVAPLSDGITELRATRRVKTFAVSGSKGAGRASQGPCMGQRIDRNLKKSRPQETKSGCRPAQPACRETRISLRVPPAGRREGKGLVTDRKAAVTDRKAAVTG